MVPFYKYSQLSITRTLMGVCKKIVRNKNENCLRQREFKWPNRSLHRNCSEGTGEKFDIKKVLQWVVSSLTYRVCELWWWWRIVFVVWLTDERRFLPYFQPGPLPEILTIANLRQTATRVWTCAEPELRLGWMKLCSNDNHYTTAPRAPLRGRLRVNNY